MKKRLMSALLTFCMVLTLLPVSVLAAPDSGTSAGSSVSTDSNGPVQIHKSVTEDPSGNLSLTLEAYLTNEAKVTYTSTPLDIVLALDTSGSMGESLKRYTPVYQLNQQSKYFIWVDGSYQDVQYSKGVLGVGAGWYNDFHRVYPMTSADDTDPGHVQFYTRTNAGSKMEALQSAVNKFIDRTADANAQITEAAQRHQLAIITYADDADTRYDLTVVTGGENGTASQMKNTVNDLRASGSTGADYAMTAVSNVLNGNSARNDAKKVVIFFTDGEPNHYSGFDDGVATSAVNSAYTLKSSQATTIYTIGVMEGANPSDVNGNFNRYMNAMSSNYPGAYSGSGWSSLDLGDRAATGNYYMAASSSEELNSVFEQIQDDIQDSLDIVTTQETALTDTMSEMFTFGNAVGEDGTGVTVQVLPFAGIDGDGTYLWGSTNNQELADRVSVTVDKGSGEIKVTGFDYTENAATITTNAGETTYSGYKLVISLPIQANLDYTGWSAGEKAYPTNKSASLGPYTQEGETGKSTTLEQSPTASVTAYAVTYSWGEEAPSGVNLPEFNTYYITGQSHEVDTTYYQGYEVSSAKDGVPGTFTFNGWDQSGTITVNADTTITGSWTFTANDQYTVTYTWSDGPDGSTLPAAVSVYAGQGYEVDTTYYQGYEVSGAKDGVPGTFTFNGWDQSGTITVNADTTITGSWTFTANDQYTVTYTWSDGPDGSTLPAAVSVYAGQGYEVDTTYYQGYEVSGTKDGVPGTFTFNGWDQSGTITVNADTTITGSWTFVENIPEYQTVNVVIYRNGNTTTPYATIRLAGNYKIGDTIPLHDLDISEYYAAPASAAGYKFEGWYNDGGWNDYKAGNTNNRLGDTITVNGWTNIICMVTDYERVVVYGVTDGDKDNAEELYSGKALYGTNVIDYLEENVENLNRDGYTHDEWFKWDAYGTGYKFSDTDTVNGWTNVYVAYTSQPQVVQVVLYRNGDMETPYKTVTLDPMNKGDVLDLNELDINDYYKADKFAKGFQFDGWFNDGAWNRYKAGEDVDGLTSITVNGWTNVIAMVWDEYPVNYHVLDGDGNEIADYSYTDCISGKNLDSYSFYTLTIPEGYAFDGWYEKAKDIGNTSKKATLPLVLKKYELYGQMDEIAPDRYNTIHVSFVDSDGTTSLGGGDVISTYPGQELITPDPAYFTPDGKTFEGWKAMVGASPMYDGAFTFAALSQLVDGNWTEDNESWLTFEAVYADEEADYSIIHVSFVDSDGTTSLGGGDVISNYPDQKLITPDPAYFTPEGKSFVGWKAMVGASPMYDGAFTFAALSQLVDGNWTEDNESWLTFEAVYADEEADYSIIHVSFVDSDGTTSLGGGDVISNYPDQKLITPDPAYFTPEGKSFVGWKAMVGASPMYDGAFTFAALSQLVDGNWTEDNESWLTFEAVYTEEKTFTVTFDSNGGSAVASQTVKEGATAVEPTAPTRSGYDFEGWFRNEALTSKYDFSAPVTTDITLYAAWDKQNTGGDGDGDSDTETYAVYYHSNYGSDARKFGGHYEENDKVKVRDNSWWDRDNYRFLGWNTEKDGSGEYYNPDDTFRMPDEDVHLYAQWRRTASDPSDSGTDRWLETQDHRLYMVGYPDDTFGPNRNMTRAEAAQMFYALLLDQNVSYTETFSDVPSDAWYAEAVNTLAALGMIDGYPDGTFRPDATITRAEFCVIALAFAYEPESFDCNFYDVSVNDWFYDYVAQATSYGWISGSNGVFRPNDAITRAEVSVIANNMLGRAADEDYVDRHEDELVTFPDVPRSYWAYYSIMETTNSHDYTKTNGMENWR
jgi:uncharacterized repeat protein (TIGR02543 family)